MKRDADHQMRAAQSLRILVLFFLLFEAGCRKSRIHRTEQTLVSGESGVTLLAVDFYSAALQRQAHYLIAFPPRYNVHNHPLPVLYLLHGMDGRPGDWIDQGHLPQYLAMHQLIAVMPDGADSYYTNAALRPHDRYEDFILSDLREDVEQHYRVLNTSASRGIAGISMGGYGAIKIALRHPESYAFAAGLSSPLDATRWPFSARRLGQSFRLIRIFGPKGAATRQDNDVFLLAERRGAKPYIYLTCGLNESLLGINRRFDALLTRHNVPHEYLESAGGHAWNQWEKELPALLAAAEQHLNTQ